MRIRQSFWRPLRAARAGATAGILLAFAIAAATPDPSGAALPASSHAAAPGIATDRLSAARTRVDVFGDSLMQQTNFYLDSSFNPATASVKVNAISGTALCDWVYPAMRTTSTGLVTNPAKGAILRLTNADAPEVALLEFHGNDFTPCIANAPFSEPEYLANYSLNLHAAIDHLLAIGTRDVIIDEGPPSEASLSSGEPDQLQQLYEQVVASYGTPRVRYASSADTSVLTASGAFAWTLPCLRVEQLDGMCLGPVVAGTASNVVRSADGIHFCPVSVGNAVGQVPGLCLAYSSGAYRYASALAGTVWSIYPRTRPVAVPVVDHVTLAASSSPGVSTITVSGHNLGSTSSVCLEHFSFPTVNGATITAVTPRVNATCFGLSSSASDAQLRVTVPSHVIAGITDGSSFVRIVTPEAESVIGLTQDELVATTS